MMNRQNAAAVLKKNKRFLITAHIGLEGDALGSELGMYWLLKKMGKEAVIVNDDGIPYGYEFLPGLDAVRRYKPGMQGIDFDCFIILDCSDLMRAGEVFRLNSAHKPVLNVDHHISNREFGDINWVDAQACSCTQMIYELYKTCRVPFDKKSALALYVGLMTDTGSFRYSNTTSATHTIAAELMSYGLDASQIYRAIYGNVPYQDMKLLSDILPHMHREAGGRIIWFEVKNSLIANKKLSFDLSEHILSFARSIRGVEVVVLFKENLGARSEIRINLRSQGNVDVNKIALSLGGGGHKTASGATIPGSLDTVRRMVLRAIKASLS